MSEERSAHRVFQNGNPFEDARRLVAPYEIRSVIDAGANVGDVARHMLANFPAATIHAFEPDPESFAALHERYQGEPRVNALDFGLSDAPGEAVLHQYAESGLNSFLPLSDSSGTFLAGYGTQEIGTVATRMITVDDFCAAVSLPTIDVLKLDLQGWEIACLEGTRRMFSEGRVRAVYVEVNFVELYEGQVYYEDVALWLRQFGFGLHSLYAMSFNEDGQLGWADALFVPQRQIP